MTTFKYISKEKRDAMPDSDFGYVKGERRLFPIVEEADVLSAAKLLKKAKSLTEDDVVKTKAKIAKIAAKKGFDIPESWKDEGFNDTTPTVTISGCDSY
jgi:hypothetical protein